MSVMSFEQAYETSLETVRWCLDNQEAKKPQEALSQMVIGVGCLLKYGYEGSVTITLAVVARHAVQQAAHVLVKCRGKTWDAAVERVLKSVRNSPEREVSGTQTEVLRRLTEVMKYVDLDLDGPMFYVEDLEALAVACCALSARVTVGFSATVDRKTDEKEQR